MMVGCVMENDKLTYSVREAAAALGIGTTLCWELVRTGKLPVIWLGRRCLIPRAALSKMLAEAKAQPNGAR